MSMKEQIRLRYLVPSKGKYRTLLLSKNYSDSIHKHKHCGILDSGGFGIGIADSGRSGLLGWIVGIWTPWLEPTSAPLTGDAVVAIRMILWVRLMSYFK